MWDIVQRVASITTLFLLITMSVVVLNNGKAAVQEDHLTLRLEKYHEDNQKAISNNLSYIESRLNRLAVNQDSYQNGTANSLLILEERIKVLESENKGLKSQQKIINNNNNLNVVNGRTSSD